MITGRNETQLLRRSAEQQNFSRSIISRKTLAVTGQIWILNSRKGQHITCPNTQQIFWVMVKYQMESSITVHRVQQFVRFNFYHWSRTFELKFNF